MANTKPLLVSRGLHLCLKIEIADVVEAVQREVVIIIIFFQIDDCESILVTQINIYATGIARPADIDIIIIARIQLEEIISLIAQSGDVQYH